MKLHFFDVKLNTSDMLFNDDNVKLTFVDMKFNEKTCCSTTTMRTSPPSK